MTDVSTDEVLSESKEVTLAIGVYGYGEAFTVSISPAATVQELQELIFSKKRYGEHFAIDTSMLQLFLACKDDAWLKADDQIVGLLKKNVVDRAYPAMFPLQPVSYYLADVPLSEPNNVVLHVLVQLQPMPDELPVTQVPVEEDISIEALVAMAKWNLSSVPKVQEVSKLLQKPLPFRLKIQHTTQVDAIFVRNGCVIRCPALERSIDHFLDLCNILREENGSKQTWQEVYDALFFITRSVLASTGVAVEAQRFHVNTTGKDAAKQLPDFLLLCDRHVLMRGEGAAKMVDASNSINSW